MPTSQEIATALERNGPALLQGDRAALQGVELRLSDTDFRGLTVIAPRRTTVEAGTLPVVLASQKTVLRGWEVPEEANLGLLVGDLDTGELVFERIAHDAKGEEHPAGPPQKPARPSEQAGKTVATKVYRLDARELVPLPSRSAALVVRGLAFDWISNPAPVELAGSAPRPQPAPAVIAPTPGAAGALPDFEPSPRHPKAPGQGVDFRVEGDAAGAWTILGSFQLPATPADLLAAPQRLPSGKQAVAAVRMSLLVVGLDQRRQQTARWGIPVAGAQTPRAGDPLTGHFAVDLRRAVPVLPAGRYAAYVVRGAEVYGPRVFDVR